MERHGIHLRREYGQNFLVNADVPARIAESCGAGEEDGVLEIGPGIGTLTVELASLYKKIVSVEIDGALLPVLSETLADFPNTTIVHADIMKSSLPSLVQEHFGDITVHVCANLPYYITTPILMLLLESPVRFGSITIMIQKEVAERLAAPPGSAEYGAVSASVAYYARIERLFNVSAGCFMPRPKVDSTVIRLVPHSVPPVEVKDKSLLFGVISAAFGQRRKTLVNALSAVYGSSISKEMLADIITDMGLSTDIRGERLGLAQFAALSDRLWDAGIRGARQR